MGRPKIERTYATVSGIKQGPDGRFRGRVTGLDGKRWMRTGITKQECGERLDALQKELESGVVARGTVGHWVAEQVASPKGGSGKPVRESTRQHREYMAGLIPKDLMAKPIGDVDADAIDAALDAIEFGEQTGRPLSRTTVGRVRALMVASWRRAIGKKAIVYNAPLATDPRSAPDDEDEEEGEGWLELHEAQALLAELVGHPWYALYIVLATVGLRRSEALGMRWEHVDLETGVLKIRWALVKLTSGELVLRPALKSKTSRRTIHLPPPAHEALKRHHEEFGEVSPFVWSQTAARLRRVGQTRSTPHGLPHPDSLRRPLAAACKRAGVPVVTPHQLRHSAATIALAAGVTERAIMDLMGHSDPRTAAHYQHVADKVREGIREKLDVAWGDLAPGGVPDADGDETASE
ncbi:MAG: site-specific integrase [Nitriliruptor sp.]|nr:MAG: site-specific integrase [Nitriliruptor sp.]